MMQGREFKGARFAGFGRPGAIAPARVYRRRLTTVARAPRWIVTLGLIGALGACGGRSRGDTVQRATRVQEQCCEQLTGPGRDQCLAAIPRVDPTAAPLPHAQASYACVTDNFVCEPATGHATPPSVQAQFDCIDALGQ